MHREGVKLGRSGGLYVDIQGGLNYVYTRDFVAVRYDMTSRLGLSSISRSTIIMHRIQCRPGRGREAAVE